MLVPALDGADEVIVLTALKPASSTSNERAPNWRRFPNRALASEVLFGSAFGLVGAESRGLGSVHVKRLREGAGD